ncbi:MAG: 4-(cytidine 5'-diphospho)-2-C-methyl-D-erythritol kinase [Lachnospiraceae bacterium]|nr:4-(cytidine 5'-diphospho)-2-C-methyl-D-erythritol kinase [Ruminococcus sp.]MCM1274340.1 4-(cytidine 5'-diphospho)-2-C-methyl-D-erythritol kinase [Lachnospiraceae bacterium]
MKEISLCAYAKLNLYLDITGRRHDGYHLLETVMQSIDLCDIVTIKTDGSVGATTVECSDSKIPQGRKNICFKAANYFYTAARSYPACEIFIDKRIPCAAGMGGGSADAAAVMIGLNKLLGEPLGMPQLLKAAARTGADVPFCVAGGTKLCRGIGDDIRNEVELPERVYLVVMPDFLCDTHGAYFSYDQAPMPQRNAMKRFLKSGEDFPGQLYNVFKELYENEKIDGMTERLKELGAEGACLTGSGSAVFGVFPDEQSAANAAREFPSCFTAVCKPLKYGTKITELKTDDNDLTNDAAGG